MKGYYRQPRETAASIDADGFLRTGDIGMVDEDGYLHLVGGNDEVIFRAGFKFYPRPVEDRILSHPAVDEAVVVGVGDSVLGQATCACVIPVEGAMLTPDEIRDWCAEALAPDSVPDRVQFVESFPRAFTGRIRRSELTASLSEGATEG
jgi:acyl-CoA synthetase (AMP-forming)/AMP-acid ligase II